MILIGTGSLERLDTYKQALSAIGRLAVATDYESLGESLLRVRPRVMVVDFDMPGLDGESGIRALHGLHPPTAIIVLSHVLPEDMELALFKSRTIRGCLSYSISAETMQRAVAAVMRGEFWMRRTLTARLLDDERQPAGLHADGQRPSQAMILDELTQREREIAALVGNGNCNREIARQLEITERTVKAHLTEIFRKLGVSSRLGLALRVTGTTNSRSRTTVS